MTRHGVWCFLLIVALAAAATAQVTHISIPAGSPQDKALQDISNEPDTTKKLAAYQQFVKDYASDPMSVAYGNSQIAQLQAASGDFAAALATGDQAIAALPGCMELLVAQVNMASQMKDGGKVLDYAEKGAKAFSGIDTEPKPDGVSDEEFAGHKASDRDGAKPSLEYLETAAFNAAVNESDATKRVAYLERFEDIFPDSKYGDQAAEYVMVSYQQLKQPAKMTAFGEKLLARKPDSVPTLILLADAYVEQPGMAAKALDYAQRALKLSSGDDPDQKLMAASAKGLIGYAFMKQEKYAAAVPELLAAAPVLKGKLEAYTAVQYRLGFAYAKLKRYAEAKEALNIVIAQGGPYKPYAEDLLTKIAAAGRRK